MAGKKLDGSYTRMLRAILNKPWRQHPTKHQQYGHLPPITKTFKVRRTRHAGHCWRSRDELISDVLLWTPSYGRAKARRPARTNIQQLCEDVALRTDQKRLTIGRSGERESGISVLAARHDDDCIYIYTLSSLDRMFVPSELFSVARHAGRSRPRSKPIQLYVRLSLRPLGTRAYHVSFGNF